MRVAKIKVRAEFNLQVALLSYELHVYLMSCSFNSRVARLSYELHLGYSNLGIPIKWRGGGSGGDGGGDGGGSG